MSCSNYDRLLLIALLISRHIIYNNDDRYHFMTIMLVSLKHRIEFMEGSEAIKSMVRWLVCRTVAGKVALKK